MPLETQKNAGDSQGECRFEKFSHIRSWNEFKKKKLSLAQENEIKNGRYNIYEFYNKDLNQHVYLPAIDIETARKMMSDDENIYIVNDQPHIYVEGMNDYEITIYGDRVERYVHHDEENEGSINNIIKIIYSNKKFCNKIRIKDDYVLVEYFMMISLYLLDDTNKETKEFKYYVDTKNKYIVFDDGAALRVYIPSDHDKYFIFIIISGKRQILNEIFSGYMKSSPIKVND